MVNYQNGKIYKIVGGGKTYYGSTCEPTLARRLAGHKSQKKLFIEGKKNNCSSFEILDELDCKIYLVENYACNGKDELHAREGYYIQNFECVNKHVAGRTNAQYKKENKEHIAVVNAKYYQFNKESIKTKVKQYKIKNKEHIKEQRAKHYEENKAEIQAKRNIKLMCECGNAYSYSNKARHEKTKKHQDYINSLEE